MLFMLPNLFNEVLAFLKSSYRDTKTRENVATVAHDAFGRRHDVLSDVCFAHALKNNKNNAFIQL